MFSTERFELFHETQVTRSYLGPNGSYPWMKISAAEILRIRENTLTRVMMDIASSSVIALQKRTVKIDGTL